MPKIKKGSKPPSHELQEKIRKVAYEFYLKRGCRHGNDWADWFEAEKSVRSGKG